MAEKVLAKDAKINKIYLTKGGKQVDAQSKEHLWGFHPVRVLKKETKDDDEVKKVIVFTPWETKLGLEPDYPLEVTDLQTLPTETTPMLINAKRISTDDEAPPEYVEKLKDTKKEEQVRESPNKGDKELIVAELWKGTPLKEFAKKLTRMDYATAYIYIRQLQKKGIYKIQKLGKGVFKIVEE